VATQVTPITVKKNMESGRLVSVATQTERAATSERSAPKRKELSPLEGRKTGAPKRARKGDLMYTEVCLSSERTRDTEPVRESDEGWTTQRRRRRIRRIRENAAPLNPREKGQQDPRGGRTRSLARRGSEATSFRVQEGSDWIEHIGRLSALRRRSKTPRGLGRPGLATS
jgi:hypothetical protein